MKSLLEIVAMRMKKKVIHISTGSTTTTTTIPYTILLLTLMLSSCISATGTQTPTAVIKTTPAITEIESGDVFEIVTETETPIPALCAIVTAEQALHLRAEPSATSQVIGWLKAGEIITVDSRAGEWWKVTARANTGYAHADYLQESECK
jgi:uncharacterized protein YgiM (DUF1202 family)